MSLVRTREHALWLEPNSSGLQLLIRLCHAESRNLGWVTAALPTGLQLNGQPMANVQLLAPHSNTRAARVLKAQLSGETVVLKTSSVIEIEVSVPTEQKTQILT